MAKGKTEVLYYNKYMHNTCNSVQKKASCTCCKAALRDGIWNENALVMFLSHTHIPSAQLAHFLNI